MRLPSRRLGGVLAVVVIAPLLVQCSQKPAASDKPAAATAAQGNLNPVDLVRLAGATPPPGSRKGERDIHGDWYASGNFPAAPGNAEVNAFSTITVRVYPDRRSLEKAMKANQDAVTTDSNPVMVGNNGRFYATLTGVMNLESGGTTFDVQPATVAQRLGATLVP